VRNAIEIAVASVALLLLVDGGGAPWFARTWFANNPVRRRYFTVFFALVLVAALIHAART